MKANYDIYPLYRTLLVNLWEWRKRMAMPGQGHLGDFKVAMVLDLTVPSVRSLFSPKSSGQGPRLVTVQKVASRIGLTFPYMLFMPDFDWDVFFKDRYGEATLKDAITMGKVDRDNII